jgi:hypothetical protein
MPDGSGGVIHARFPLVDEPALPSYVKTRPGWASGALVAYVTIG